LSYAADKQTDRLTRKSYPRRLTKSALVMIITGFNSGTTRELLRLPRHMLCFATELLTGHVELNHHVSIMGIRNDPIHFHFLST